MASSLTIENVHAAYGAVRVIEDVSINVKAGETVALLGTNGNGKSTLMKCVMGIVRPVAGRIVAEIDGVKHDLVGKTTEEMQREKAKEAREKSGNEIEVASEREEARRNRDKLERVVFVKKCLRKPITLQNPTSR